MRWRRYSGFGCSRRRHGLSLQLLLCLFFLGTVVLQSRTSPAQQPALPPLPLRLGNGTLTVLGDSNGGIRSVRYPYPSHFELLPSSPLFSTPSQVTLPTNSSPALGWFFLHEPSCSADDTLTLQPLCETAGIQVGSYRIPGRVGDAEVELCGTVLPDLPVFITVCKVINAGSGIRVGWRHALVPNMRRTRYAYRLLESLSPPLCLATVYDPKNNTLWQFTPEKRDQATFLKAEELAKSGAAIEEWRVLGEGIWVVAATEPKPEKVELFPKPSALPERETAADVDDSQPQAYLRSQGATLLFPQGSSGASIRIRVAFGCTYEEAAEALSKTSQFAATAAPCASTMEPSPTHHGEGEATSEANKENEAEAMLLLSRCPSTGSIVELPTTGLDSLRQGVLAAAALETLGEERAVESYAGFWRQRIREGTQAAHQSRRGVPPHVYADGDSPFPFFVVDRGALAYWISLLYWGTRTLPEAEAATRLAAYLPEINAAADTLASWLRMDQPQPAPFPSYDPETGHDTDSFRHTVEWYLGVWCALEIFQTCKLSKPPAMVDCMTSLDVRIRFAVLNQQETWAPDAPTLIWLSQFFPEDHVLWRLKSRWAGVSRSWKEQLDAVRTELAQAEPNTTTKAAMMVLASPRKGGQ